MPSGVEFATAFDGRLEPVKTSLLYRLGILAVFCASVLLPVVYLAIIALAASGVWWYARHAAIMFSFVRSPRLLIVLLVVYVGPLFAGTMLVIFMVLPLFWARKRVCGPIGSIDASSHCFMPISTNSAMPCGRPAGTDRFPGHCQRIGAY